MPEDKLETSRSEQTTGARSQDTRLTEISPGAYELLREAPFPSEFWEIARETIPPTAPSPSVGTEPLGTSTDLDTSSVAKLTSGVHDQTLEMPIRTAGVFRPQMVPADTEAFYLTDLTIDLTGVPHLTRGLSQLALWPLGPLVTNCRDGEGEDEDQEDGGVPPPEEGVPPTEEEPPPVFPEELGAIDRAALVLHCGGKAQVINKNAAVIFSTSNVITDHTQLMYLRLVNFGFKPQEIMYLSPFFERGPVTEPVEFPTLKNYEGEIESVEGEIRLKGLNTLQNVKAFFAIVQAMRYAEVFVYIHGHGNTAEKDNDRIVLADDENNERGESILFKDLGKWIMAINANHVGVAVDTCYSGQLGRYIEPKDHLYVAMSTRPDKISIGDERNGYHRLNEKRGDWSDLFIANFRREDEDKDKVDVVAERAWRRVGNDSHNMRWPRRAPDGGLKGGH